jgi:3-deoxy-D-manno-octulosonic acid kinase
MSAIVEQSLALPGGGILYDASRLRKSPGPLFSREHWRAQGALKEVAGGRGSVCFLSTPEGSWVWRHYRRGGFVARMVADAYLWLGAARTRSFAEWRLLARLRAMSLPVPAPIAAGYWRKGLTYRADIITEELPNARTLAVAMSAAELPAEQWRNVGRTIAAFHRQGVQHADLNAHNILLCGGAGEVYLIDFDRGRIRARGTWEQSVFARLQRSLEKISARRGAKFGSEEWGWLMDGVTQKKSDATGSTK